MRGKEDIGSWLDSGGFGFVDGLVTNFHVPRSSLMMLVAASCRQKFRLISTPSKTVIAFLLRRRMLIL